MKSINQKTALACAVEAARAAGKMMRDNLRSTKKVNEATPHDIKLELDVRCQKRIERTLRRGFPGIPIAILRPDCKITLVESHQRKGVFLREASRNLRNITVVTDRAENLKSGYDWLVSRAVSSEDIVKLQLANNLALLIGREELPGFEHRESIPWGTGRFLAFHVERS